MNISCRLHQTSYTRHTVRRALSVMTGLAIAVRASARSYLKDETSRPIIRRDSRNTRAMLQWPRSPRSHPKNPRFSNSVSSRSVLARRCSRDTATLEGWITCASTPRASSQRASQKPSRPASKATAIRAIVRPALTASSRQRCSTASSRSGLHSPLPPVRDYYVSRTLITKDQTERSAGLRIPAGEIEQLVTSRLRRWLLDPGSVYKATSALFPDPAAQQRLVSKTGLDLKAQNLGVLQHQFGKAGPYYYIIGLALRKRRGRRHAAGFGTWPNSLERFVADSTQEEGGFELPVPLERGGWNGRTRRHASQGKTNASAAFGHPSGEIAEHADQPTPRGIASAEGGHMIVGQGAVPIIRNGVLEGACGVSGGTAQQDEDCARAGVAQL
jgi:Haem-degrading